MIEKLFKNPHILHQTTDDCDALPEPPIAGCTDSSGLVCLSQEGRSIAVNMASIPELCKMLRRLQVLAAEGGQS